MNVEVDRAQTEPIIEATVAVLAGGVGRRTGAAKAMLPVAEITLVEWLYRRLAPNFAEALVVAAGAEQVPPVLREHLVLDRLPGAGPLAAIESALQAASRPAVFTVACDVPYATPGLARELLLELGDRDAAVPVIDGLPQPACAVYARSALPVITTALDSGERAVRAVLDRLNIARVVRGDAGTFTNLNTPADYRAFLESLRHHG